MATKLELIAQLKAENPTMISTINGVEMQLNAEQYEKACNDWADMRIEQIANETAAQAAKTAAQAKLAALGLTTDDLAALGL